MLLRRLAAALAAATTTATVLAATAAPAEAAVVPAPRAAADTAAGWVARALSGTGHLNYPAGFGGGVDYQGTVDGVLALVADGTGATAVSKAVAYLDQPANVNQYVVDPKRHDRPGALAGLILVAVATGHNPRLVAGSDMVQRLLATEGLYQHIAGLFGAQPPTYDGAYRQSLALLALHAAGVKPDSKAVDWLVQQQCPDGGWNAYHPTGTACAAGSEDTNSTAVAVQALVALGVRPAHPVLSYLHGVQDADGGFPYQPGAGTDANSTGLVLQALAAEHVNPVTFTRGGQTPVSALERLQLGCAATAADRGAFTYQAQGLPTANEFATVQAIPGLLAAPFPVTARTLSTAVPALACAAPAPRNGPVKRPVRSPAQAPTVGAHPAAAAGAAPATTGTGAAGSATVSGGAQLPRTGAPTAALALGGVAALVLGCGLALAGRRRRPDRR